MTRNEETSELIYGDESMLVNFGHYPRMGYERVLPRKQEPADLQF